MKLTALFSALIFLLPISSEAYFTTSQTATRITDNTTLYTISFDFGFPTRDLVMPIGAIRDTTDEASPYIEYEFVDSDNEASILGTSAGIILTESEDVEIKNNQYFLPAGESARFSLVTLVTLPADSKEQDLALRVSHLPFTMVIDGNNLPAQLNPSELQYYITPSL